MAVSEPSRWVAQGPRELVVEHVLPPLVLRESGNEALHVPFKGYIVYLIPSFPAENQPDEIEFL